MLKLLGLCISCLVIGITVGLPTKDIDELIYRLEELKQQNHYDEPYDFFSLARPVAFRDSFNRDNIGSSSNDLISDPNLDGYDRKLENTIRLLNLGDELNRKRLILERKLTNAHRHLPMQSKLKSKQQPQNQEYPPDSALNQQGLKRAIDPIGGGNLLKRAVDRIGGGNLLKRR